MHLKINAYLGFKHKKDQFLNEWKTSLDAFM